MEKNDFDEVDLEIRLAQTIKEVRYAFQLRYHVFGDEGYLNKDHHSAGLESENFDLLEGSALFVAYYQEKPIGTVRLILDSEYGVPLDKEVPLFKELREEGKTFAEGSRLAVLPEFRGFKQVSLGLMKADIIWGILNGATDIISVGNMGSSAPGRFNVAEKFFKPLGYEGAAPSFFMESFQEYALPLKLQINKIKEPFRTYMQSSSEYIEKPYHCVDFDIVGKTK